MSSSSSSNRKQYGVRINGVLHREYFDSPQAARAWQAKLKREAELEKAGLAPTVSAIKTRDAIVEFLKDRVHTCPTSWRIDSMVIRKHILPHDDLMNKDLHRVSVQDWRRIFERGGTIMQGGLSAGSHNRIRALVSKLYNNNITKHHPPRAVINPIKSIESLEVEQEEVEFLDSKEKIAAYVEASTKVPNPAWKYFVLVALNTGMREGNLIGLRWCDVNLTDRVIHVRQKFVAINKEFAAGSKGSKSKNKIIGISSALAEALQEWMRESSPGNEDDLVFAGKRREYCSPGWVADNHAKTLKLAGLEHIKFHALRHTFAVMYLENGGKLENLKNILLHSSITMTEKYLHIVRSSIAEKANVFQVGLPSGGKTENTGSV